MALPADRIQGRIWRGYRTAAARLGRECELYRPIDPMDPLRLIDLMGTPTAVFDSAPSFKFANPAKGNNPLRYALVDGAQVQPGDYLVGDDATHFVAEMPALQSIVCVRCNAVLKLLRPTRNDVFGSTPPPGATQDVAVLQGWPASLLNTGRGPSDDAQVPGDVNPNAYEALLPAVACLPPPRAGDALMDAHGRRFAVDGFDQGSTGWRIIARLLAVA